MVEHGESLDRVEKKAKVLAIGAYWPGLIRVEQTGHDLPKTIETEALIKRGWIGKENWRSEPLVRLESFTLGWDGLTLRTGETTYKEYVGTRDLQTLRRFGVDSLANPISTSAVLISTDNKLIISQKKQGDAVGATDAIGGYIHREKDLGKNGLIDVFGAAAREIEEETGFGRNELSDMVCLGLSYEYGDLCHPVLSFVAKIDHTSQGFNAWKDPSEEEEIQTIIVDPFKLPNSHDFDYVMEVLKTAHPDVEPDGRVTIALARKWLQGKKYQERIVRTLEKV